MEGEVATKGGDQSTSTKIEKPRPPPGWNELKAILGDQLERDYLLNCVGIHPSVLLTKGTHIQMETLCYYGNEIDI